MSTEEPKDLVYKCVECNKIYERGSLPKTQKNCDCGGKLYFAATFKKF